jgi:assimilatory nitrate reductase catalytic subunit
MTRTGLSPRLCAHSPEPIVEIHPADAKLAKLDDGGFAKATTESGSAILKVSISEGQQRGTIFTPIHWSDATAAHARIGDMVTAATDPFSGQPDLKATPARVEPLTFAYRGFALSRGEITPPSEAWFARAAVVGGDGLLFASNEPPEAWRDFARQQMPDGCEITEHIDPERDVVRVAAFRSGQLDACIFLGPAQAPPQWDAMRALFEAGELDENERLILLSERGDEGRIDNGPVICACFGVRLAAIRDALETGIASDVADIGRTLRAGTNCGSCVPELRGIIEKAAQPV